MEVSSCCGVPCSVFVQKVHLLRKGGLEKHTWQVQRSLRQGGDKSELEEAVALVSFLIVTTKHLNWKLLKAERRERGREEERREGEGGRRTEGLFEDSVSGGGRAWWWDLEAAGHLDSTVRKQGEMDSAVQLIFSFSSNPGPQTIGCCCPHLEQVFQSQLTRNSIKTQDSGSSPRWLMKATIHVTISHYRSWVNAPHFIWAPTPTPGHVIIKGTWSTISLAQPAMLCVSLCLVLSEVQGSIQLHRDEQLPQRTFPGSVNHSWHEQRTSEGGQIHNKKNTSKRGNVCKWLLSLSKLKQENFEYKASLGYLMRASLKKKKLELLSSEEMVQLGKSTCGTSVRTWV
jgi:hypothetical protein